MKVVVTTQDHPEGEVRRLVAWTAALLEVQDYVEEVRVTSTKHPLCGRCDGPRVLIRIGAAELFPHVRKYPGLKRVPTHRLADWKEALVKVAAHEFQHSRQFRARDQARAHNRAVRAGANAGEVEAHLRPVPPLSEVEAERVAAWALARYRDPESQRTLAEEMAEAQAKVERRVVERALRAAERAAKASAPETRMAALLMKIERWERKRKTAETYLKK